MVPVFHHLCRSGSSTSRHRMGVCRRVIRTPCVVVGRLSPDSGQKRLHLITAAFWSTFEPTLPVSGYLGRSLPTRGYTGSDITFVAFKPLADMHGHIFETKTIGVGIGQDRAYTIVGSNKDETLSVNRRENIDVFQHGDIQVDSREKTRGYIRGLTHIDRLGHDS